MEVYARNLIEALGRVRPDLRLTAFVNRNAAAQPGPWHDVECVTVPVDSRSRVKWVLAEQLVLPPMARRARIDLLHSPANLAPALGRYTRVLTVHDLIHRTFPEAHAGVRARVLGVIMPLGIRRSHRLIADSRATRDDLVGLLDGRPEKIAVVPLGRPEPHPERAMPESELRDKLGLGERTV